MIDHPSPNFGDRIGGGPTHVVLHYTAMESVEAALSRLCDPGPEVSAHYLIARDGRVFALVDEAKRAWHAGRSYWQGETDMNSRSIGIELDNPGSLNAMMPFAEAQISALEALLAGICARHAMSADRVLGHSDIAVGRKPDPGPKFDWDRLARLGLAEARPALSDARPFLSSLAAIGYAPEADPQHLLAAFRLRWRPGATGPVSASDERLAAALAARRLTAADTPLS